MIFLLDTIKSFLGCVGMGSVFVTEGNHGEDFQTWILSGFSHVTTKTLGWVYCAVEIKPDPEQPSESGVDIFSKALDKWRVFEGIVSDTLEDAMSVKNEFASVGIVSADDIRVEAELALDVIKTEQQKREKAEMDALKRQMEAQNLKNPQVKDEMDALKRQMDAQNLKNPQIKTIIPGEKLYPTEPPVNPAKVIVIPTQPTPPAKPDGYTG